jgi:hypothetical protein
MISSPSADNDSFTNFGEIVVETRSPMHLPVAVHLIIYKYLFSTTKNITLNTNDSDFIVLTRTVKLNLASLRLLKAFHIEACPVV